MHDDKPRPINTDKMRHQVDRSRPVPPGCVPVPPEPPKGTSADQLIAWKQQQEAAWMANMPALTSCPPWCDDADVRHEYQSTGEDDYLYLRIHGIRIGEHVEVHMIERVPARGVDRPITWDKPEVMCFDIAGWDPLHAGQARQLGIDLQRAADKADELAALMSTTRTTP